MVYTELKGEFVLATLGKGTKVIMCDFKSTRMADCEDMTVRAINGFVSQTSVKFFTAVEA